MRITELGDVVHIDPDDLVGPHFRLREFGAWPASLHDRLFRLVAILEQVRGRVGAPLQITSGYRTREQNARCGGSPRSQHLYARAVDFRAYLPGDPERQDQLTLDAHWWLRARADGLGIGGLGWYRPAGGRPARIHVDIRGRAPGDPLKEWEKDDLRGGRALIAHVLHQPLSEIDALEIRDFRELAEDAREILRARAGQRS